MKRIRFFVILIFLISCCLYGYSYFILNAENDKSAPEITVPESVVEMSIQDDDSAILDGITAMDSKDGDVTGSLVVENISNMMEDGTRTANIVAFDSDNNISRKTRDLIYTDYTKPKFSLSAPLRFANSYSNIVADLGATDCMDGDISGRIRVSFNEQVTYSNYGEITVTFSVSNNIGDTVKLPATVEFYDQNGEQNRPKIELNDYLVYLKLGESLDPIEYVKSIKCNGRTVSRDTHGNLKWDTYPEEKLDNDGNLLNESDFEYADELITSDKLEIENPVDSSTTGVYEIIYSITSVDGIVGKVRLIVVVES